MIQRSLVTVEEFMASPQCKEILAPFWCGGQVNPVAAPGAASPEDESLYCSLQTTACPVERLFNVQYRCAFPPSGKSECTQAAAHASARRSIGRSHFPKFF